jgi:hypothetical protein
MTRVPASIMQARMESKCHLQRDAAAEHIPQTEQVLGLDLLVAGLTFSVPVVKKFGDIVDEAGTCAGRRLLLSAGPAIWQALELLTCRNSMCRIDPGELDPPVDRCKG